MENRRKAGKGMEHQSEQVVVIDNLNNRHPWRLANEIEEALHVKAVLVLSGHERSRPEVR